MSQPDEEGPEPIRGNSKTPLYEAFHRDRYHRQDLIRSIQQASKTTLLCYVSDPQSSVNRDDPVAMVDLLHNVPEASNIDFLLHTGGGDVDSAEKITKLLWSKVGTSGSLRVIVPDFAKSAGTLIAIGADAIVMSESSELGPIDPQVVISDGDGNRLQHSVQNYLDAYEKYKQALTVNPEDEHARIMLSKLQPERLVLFEGVKERAKRLAEKHLQEGMFRRGQPGNFTAIAAELIDTKKWLTHGQMIDYNDAQRMGLTVEVRGSADNQWQALWKLYCLFRLALAGGEHQKFFESDYASIPL